MNRRTYLDPRRPAASKLPTPLWALVLATVLACESTTPTPIPTADAAVAADATAPLDAAPADAAPLDDAAAPDAGADDATPADDAMGGEDAVTDAGQADAAAPDAAPDPDTGVADSGAAGTCGGARPTISGIRGTEGLVIARDGTIYYSTAGGVGRLVPNGMPESRWVRIAGAQTVWGLALDAANRYLYVGSPTTRAVHRIDLTQATPAATEFVANAGGPNGLTIAPSGELYFSDFGGGHVYRADTTGATATRQQVTASTIRQANGVMFMPDGTLLVASYATGTLHRLTLTAGAETARTPFAMGLGSADGLALDAMGNVYVSDQAGQRVVRLDAAGMNPVDVVTSVGSPANMEFGAGALDCEDLYITSGGAMRRYEMGTVAGAAVPWH